MVQPRINYTMWTTVVPSMTHSSIVQCLAFSMAREASHVRFVNPVINACSTCHTQPRRNGRECFFFFVSEIQLSMSSFWNIHNVSNGNSGLSGIPPNENIMPHWSCWSMEFLALRFMVCSCVIHEYPLWFIDDWRPSPTCTPNGVVNRSGVVDNFMPPTWWHP